MLVPFIEPKIGVVYKCELCLDYGGLLDDELTDLDGLPVMQQCSCQYENDD